MKYEVYSEVEISDDFSVFDFISTGKNGDILKRIYSGKDSPVSNGCRTSFG